MATRSKTVEFVYQGNVTSLALNTKRTFTGNTIYLPESSIVFRSVTLQADWGDDSTAVSSPTNWILGIKLGAAAESTATVTDTMTNSGEAWSVRYLRDVTAYFTTNWSGTSMAWEASVQQAVSVTQNHVVKVIITYEYDDTSSTHIKTIRVPIESTRSLMTTSYQTLGGATAIPAFKGSYLPEASVTIRQIWVELWGNTADITTATDWVSTARVGGAGGTTYDWYDQEAAPLSARWAYGIIDITGRTLTSAEALEIIVTGITSRLTQMGGMVCVTYEFAPSSSTTIYNSLMLGGVDSTGWMGGTAAGDEDTWTRSIYIDEPTTITLQESGVCLFLTSPAAVTINVAVGSQTDTSYAFTAGGMQVGQYSVVHRIDAAGAKGTAGITLARGANDYNIQFRSTTAVQGWGFSGFLILNYTSGKATDGVGVHAQTRYFHLADTAADTTVRQVTNVTTPTIPESQYYIVGVVAYTASMVMTIANGSQVLQLERTGGLGWQAASISTWVMDGEVNLILTYGATKDQFSRWPGDPDTTRADIETARDWRLDSQPTTYAGWGIWVTWHAHEWTVAGTVSGYADADGAGLAVHIHRAETDEFVKSVTTTAGGSFTTPWFDNVETLYCEVYEDSTHVGRSANTTAS